MPRRAKLSVLPWFRKERKQREHERADLLYRRLREYFEERQGQVIETFCPCREEVIYEFELRGYPPDEIRQALAGLTHEGTLEHRWGWYTLRRHGSVHI